MRPWHKQGMAMETRVIGRALGIWYQTYQLPKATIKGGQST